VRVLEQTCNACGERGRTSLRRDASVVLATKVVVCGSGPHLTSVFRQHPSAVNTSFGGRAYVIHASAPRSHGRSHEPICRPSKGFNNCNEGMTWRVGQTCFPAITGNRT
jgi:hypothetical protein